MELDSQLHRRVVIKYCDKTVARGKLSWSRDGNFDFIADEDGESVHYLIETFPVFRGIGFSVSRNGVKIFVTHRDRRSTQQ
jgi:hypothetical protein